MPTPTKVPLRSLHSAATVLAEIDRARAEGDQTALDLALSLRKRLLAEYAQAGGATTDAERDEIRALRGKKVRA